MTTLRVDPLEPAWRGRISEQIDRARRAGAAAIRQRELEAVGTRPTAERRAQPAQEEGA